MEQSLQVYLVEDSSMIRSNLTTALEELCGIQVVAAGETESEASAWLANRGNSWRLAIVDLFLRKGSGFNVLTSCRHRTPEQKVVVLTNYATPETRAACVRLGADAVFDKSNEVDALIDYCSELARN